MSVTVLTILIIFVLFGGIVLFLWLMRRIKEDQEKLDWVNSRKFKLIAIKVPKNNEKTPLAAEQMFVALHGIFSDGAKFQEHISFEIVAKNQFIQFYVYTPEHLVDFVTGQIYAQYPTLELNEAQDYTQYELHNKSLAASEFVLEKLDFYPIKTFPNFEVDPIASITAVLSNLKENEQIWIQTIISPQDNSWHKQAQNFISSIKEGKPFVETVGKKLTTKAGHLGSHLLTQAITGTISSSKDGKDGGASLSSSQEIGIKGIEEKMTKLSFKTKLRIMAISQSEESARAKIAAILGAYKQFNSASINGFTVNNVSTDQNALKVFQYRYLGEGGFLLNTEELASIYHFPNETVATPTIVWAGAKKGEPPADLPLVSQVPSEQLTVFAKTNFRNHIEKFGIKLKDRRLHMYAIGKTGTGKSTLLENMIIDDIKEGRGVAVVDPHGELVSHVLDFIPEHRINDVIYFNPADKENTIGFNLLESVDPELRQIIASGTVGVFKKIFGESWGPRLEYILRNTIMALLDYPDATLLGVMKVLVDKNFRKKVIDKISDPIVKDFFVNEYEKYDPKFRMEAISPIQNKVGQFLSSPLIRNIVGQPHSSFSIDDAMNNGKILLLDLSIGKIGEDNSALLGSMLITKIQLAAMSRANIPESERRDFYLYVDEFQNFATDSFAVILSEARKYHLNLIMTNQYIAQMPETVANAIFGNVGTMVTFRVGATDGSALEKEMEPIFNLNDMVNLPNYQIYIKMAIDGVTCPAFSANTLPPVEEMHGFKNTIINASRHNYTRPRAVVEKEIIDWSAQESGELPTDFKPDYERFKDKSGEIWYAGIEHTDQNINSEMQENTETIPEISESANQVKAEPVKEKFEESDQAQNQDLPFSELSDLDKPENHQSEKSIVTAQAPRKNTKEKNKLEYSPEEIEESLKKGSHGFDDLDELEEGETVQF